MFSRTKKTWLYHVNPSIKLLSLFLFFALFLFVSSWTNMSIIFLITVVFFIFFSGFRITHYRYIIPLLCFFFVSTAIPMILYGKGEQIIWQWAWIKVSEESVNQGLLISFRTGSLILGSLLFSATTQPIHLFYSLMQQCSLPPKYAYAFLAVLNLLPQLKTELMQRQLVEKMMKRKRSLREKLMFYSLPLLSQAIRRAFITAVAMESKGFTHKKKRTFYYRFSYSRNDFLFLSVLITLTITYLWMTTNI